VTPARPRPLRLGPRARRGRPPASATLEIAALALALAERHRCSEEIVVRAFAPLYVRGSPEKFVQRITRAARKLKRGPKRGARGTTLDTLMVPYAGLASGIDHQFLELCKSLLPKSILRRSR
jgi:hypothetical protein